MTDLTPILQFLARIPGLTTVKILQPEDRDHILRLEEKHNYGVKECLQKEIILIALHDETFRKPFLPEVIHNNGTVLFPAVPFPELKDYKTITGSPSSVVHHHLVNKYYNGNVTNHATLLIGIDITAYKKS